jgi:hypothetical protein
MACDELCDATATGTARIAGSNRIYVLAPVTRKLSVATPAKVRLRASARALKDFARAFRRNRQVSVTLRVTATDTDLLTAFDERRVRARR